MIRKIVRGSLAVIAIITYVSPVYAMEKNKPKEKEIVTQNPLYSPTKKHRSKSYSNLKEAFAPNIDDQHHPPLQRRNTQVKLNEQTLVRSQSDEKVSFKTRAKGLLKKMRNFSSLPNTPESPTEQLARLIKEKSVNIELIKQKLLSGADPNYQDRKGNTIIMHLVHRIATNPKQNEDDKKQGTNDLLVLDTIIKKSIVPINWKTQNKQRLSIHSLMKGYCRNNGNLQSLQTYIDNQIPDPTENDTVKALDFEGKFRTMPKKQAREFALQLIVQHEQKAKTQKILNFLPYLERPESRKEKLAELRSKLKNYKTQEKTHRIQQEITTLCEDIYFYENLEAEILKNSSLCNQQLNDVVMQQLKDYFKTHVQKDYENLQSNNQRTPQEEKMLILYNKWQEAFQKHPPTTL